MRIDSPNLGSIEVSDDRIIEFPAGLPGFEDCRRYTLLRDEGGPGLVYLLQGVDRPELLLSVAPPEQFGINYEFELSDEEIAALKVSDPGEVALLVILRRSDEAPQRKAADGGVRANLVAPLVINLVSRLGVQKIIGKLGCDITLRPLDNQESP